MSKHVFLHFLHAILHLHIKQIIVQYIGNTILVLLRNMKEGVIMKIAICDDEEYFANEILERIEKYEIFDVLPNRFDCFYDPDDLLARFDHYQYDLVYLDIEFPKVNGIDIAFEIKRRKPNCMIIFVTNHEQYVHESHEVEAFQYIEKPINDKFFIRELERAIQKYKKLSKSILFHTDDGKKFVKTSDIIYLETHYPTYKLITTQSKSYYGKFKKVQDARKELIENHFYKLNRSIIINLNYIDTFDNESITMINNDELPLTKTKRTEFKTIYYHFIDKENLK